jgi:lipopolysaccharide/colanic/teichoic acid biosynthesis glycosyltransferase
MPVLPSPPAGAQFVSAPRVARRLPKHDGPVVIRRQRVRSRYLLDEALFRNSLLRECKQADRYEEPFGIALVTLAPRLRGPSSSAHVADALRAVARDADLTGWFEQGVVVGLIRSGASAKPAETAECLEHLLEGELDRRLGADAANCNVRAGIYSPHAGPEALPLLETAGRVSGVVHRAAKRALDIIGSAVLLAVASPLFLAVAAVVKWNSKGPVLFCQKRVGRHGRPFVMLKFRTMQAGADEEIHQDYVSRYIKGWVGDESQAAARPVFKLVGDPRVTTVGHWLRRSSLDELPQFWNVLKGEMSLVGPRPPLPYEVNCYKPWHLRRVLEAKPGITGLWQVTGRGRTTFDEMVRLDIRYAKDQSLWLDLKILLATPRAVVSGSGAH